MGGPDLAASVMDAGGLGMVSWTEPAPAGCGINFLVPFIRSPGEVAELSAHARVVEFFYGDPDPELVDAARGAGAIVGWQAGSREEARAAWSAGCDYVVAQGIEAGGHVRGIDPLEIVLEQVVSSVEIPVVAAGGIATPERVAELLGRGASAVRVGTRFLVCPEANAHEDYVGNLLSAEEHDTELTDWFDEGWPDAPHRVLRSALESARRSGWKSALPPTRGSERPIGDMAQYAGAGVGQVKRVQEARDVLTDLVALC